MSLSSHDRGGDSSRLLLAGAAPGAAAGSAVSSEILLAALVRLGPVDLLSHEITLLPTFRTLRHDQSAEIRLGTQPLTIHAEAIFAGLVHRRKLTNWRCAWVVTSRYAGSLFRGPVPYVIWEATTMRDELTSIPAPHLAQSRDGTGIGAALHRALLPMGDRLERAFYRGASGLFAMSEHTRQSIIAQHGVPAERVGLLSPPPTVAFLNALGDREHAGMMSRTAAPRLLFVGRVTDPRKNARLLIDAHLALRQHIAGAQLTIVGPYTERWRRSLEIDLDAAGITLLGRLEIDGLVNAYLTHDLLLLPSRQEGFGLVVAEALHAGVPVVATRCGGPEAMIRESGGGELVAHSAAELADAAGRILTDPVMWMRLSRCGRRYARRELSFERFAQSVGEITDHSSHHHLAPLPRHVASLSSC